MEHFDKVWATLGSPYFDHLVADGYVEFMRVEDGRSLMAKRIVPKLNTAADYRAYRAAQEDHNCKAQAKYDTEKQIADAKARGSNRA